jgi:hypothetical protein
LAHTRPHALQPLAPPGSTHRPVMQHPSHGAATVVAGRTCRTSLSIWYAHERFHSQQRGSTNQPAMYGPVGNLQIELFGLRWLWLRWPIDGVHLPIRGPLHPYRDDTTTCCFCARERREQALPSCAGFNCGWVIPGDHASQSARPGSALPITSAMLYH